MLTSSIYKTKLGDIQWPIKKNMANLLTFVELYFEQFMNRFLVIQSIHDSQVYHATQVDKVRLCPILDGLNGFGD